MFFLKAGSTLPPPFNILPTVKSFANLLKRLRGKGKKNSDKYKGRRKILLMSKKSIFYSHLGAIEAQLRHVDIMRCIIKRFVLLQKRLTQCYIVISIWIIYSSIKYLCIGLLDWWIVKPSVVCDIAFFCIWKKKPDTLHFCAFFH